MGLAFAWLVVPQYAIAFASGLGGAPPKLLSLEHHCFVNVSWFLGDVELGLFYLALLTLWLFAWVLLKVTIKFFQFLDLGFKCKNFRDSDIRRFSTEFFCLPDSLEVVPQGN